MGYHIIHQFDEQWLDEIAPDCARRSSDELAPALESKQRKQASGASDSTILQGSARAWWRVRSWFIVVVSLLIAGCAFLFALNALHRADDLQQRLMSLEAQAKVKR